MQSNKSRIELEQEEIKKLLGSKRKFSAPSTDQVAYGNENAKADTVTKQEVVTERDQ